MGKMQENLVSSEVLWASAQLLQIQNKISTPDIEAPLLQLSVILNWTSRIDHLTRYKVKTSSHALDHHTVISLSTFLTHSALHSYKWYKWKWSEMEDRKKNCWSKPADHAFTSATKTWFIDDAQLSDRTHTYWTFSSTVSLSESFLYPTIHSSSRVEIGRPPDNPRWWSHWTSWNRTTDTIWKIQRTFILHRHL